MDVITYVSKRGPWYLLPSYHSRVWSYISCATAGSQWSIVNGAIPSLTQDWWPLYILNSCSQTATVADAGLAAWGRHTLDDHNLGPNEHNIHLNDTKLIGPGSIIWYHIPCNCGMMKLLIHSQTSFEVWEWISNFIIPHFIMDVIIYASKRGPWYLLPSYHSRVWSYLSCAPAGSQWSIVNGAIPSLTVDWWPLYILNSCSHTATVADAGLAAWGRHTLDNHIPWQYKDYFPGQGSTLMVVHLSNGT